MRQKNKKPNAQAQLEQLRKKLKVKTLEETKLNEVKRALRITNDDKVLAAALLRIGKTTIYRALKD